MTEILETLDKIMGWASVLEMIISLGISLTMRLYEPLPAILHGTWTPSHVKRVD